jgi:hypothetical protein
VRGLRSSTLVLLHLLIQNGIFNPIHRHFLLYIQFSRIDLPSYFSFITTTRAHSNILYPNPSSLSPVAHPLSSHSWPPLLSVPPPAWGAPKLLPICALLLRWSSHARSLSGADGGADAVVALLLPPLRRLQQTKRRGGFRGGILAARSSAGSHLLGDSGGARCGAGAGVGAAFATERLGGSWLTRAVPCVGGPSSCARRRGAWARGLAGAAAGEEVLTRWRLASGSAAAASIHMAEEGRGGKADREARRSSTGRSNGPCGGACAVPSAVHLNSGRGGKRRRALLHLSSTPSPASPPTPAGAELGQVQAA